jgi:SAM-dependent methyltransferase
VQKEGKIKLIYSTSEQMNMANPITRFLRNRSRHRKFLTEFNSLAHQAGLTRQRFDLEWKDRHPCLDDRTSATSFDPHYIYHTAWAARAIAGCRPSEHVDISSSLYFCSLVSAFVPVSFYDFRPAPLRLSGLSCRQVDLTRLPFEDRSIESLSCMHVVEHVGLGRYGDLLDYDGDLKAMKQLQRVLAVKGRLLFVVPVGSSRICFNAHRIYDFKQVREAFPDLMLEEFTLIPDDAASTGPIINCDPSLVERQSYACGCFLFKREQE